MGFSFNNGKKIYDFKPSGEPSIAALRARQAFPGQVTDATQTFNKARELGLDVRVENRTVGLGTYLGANMQVRLDQALSPLTSKNYMLPPKTGPFPQGCYNCATYPTSLGLPTPFTSGVLNGGK